MMDSKRLFTVLAILGFISFLPGNSLFAQLKSKVKEIKSAVSKDHVRLGNSSVLMVTPENFTSVNGLNGIMQESSNTSIIVLEIPGSLESTSRMFGANAMKEKNFNVLVEEELYFNDYPGYYIEAEQNTPSAVYLKYMLSFGIDSTTVILNASFPKSRQDSIGAIIKKSLFSAVYSKFNSSTGIAAANYDLDLSGSPFKLARSASNSQVYTTDGKMPTENPEKTALLTTRSEGRLEFRDKKAFATERIKQLPGITAIEIETIQETFVNGLTAVEIIAYGEDRYTKEKKLIYQLMAFVDYTYYMVIGTTSAQFDKNKAMFQQIAKTLRLK